MLATITKWSSLAEFELGLQLLQQRSLTRTCFGAGIVALALLGSACSKTNRLARPLPGTALNQTAPVLAGEQVKLVTAPGHPSLQLVRRDGDPSSGLAVAVFPPGGTAGSLQLAALIQARLERSNVKHRLEAHGVGFVLVRDVEGAEAATGWMKAVHTALNEPVSDADVAALNNQPLLQSAFARADSLSPYGLCMGTVGAEGREALLEALENTTSADYPEFLENLRADSATAARVGFAALGAEDVLALVEKEHDGSWKAGEALDDSWTPEPQAAVTTAQGAREIRVGLRVSESGPALAGARALQDDDHPLHARLHSLSPDFSVQNVQVTLRPAGACVGFTVTFGAFENTSLERVAAAGLLAKEELLATVGQPADRDERTLAVLSPQGAHEAVALAAWTAVRSARVGEAPQEVLEFRSTAAQPVTHQAVAQALKGTIASWAARTLPTTMTLESGQNEMWLLAASPCGTAAEASEEAGLRALTVTTLARNFDGQFGVSLEPWTSPRGMGLIAHGPALGGESPVAHGRRIARALGAAYSGSAVDGRFVAAARSSQLERVGSHPADELASNILGAGHTSGAQPYGLGKTVSTLSVADVERSRADLAQEPLRLAILANGTDAQGRAAQQTLERWLAPTREHVTACPEVGADEIPAGTWDIETIDDEISAGTVIVVSAPASPVVGHATAYLLNRRGGYIERAFSSPGLAAEVTAEFWGDSKAGGLLLRVQAEPHLLGKATHQARGLLDALSKTPIPTSDVRDAMKRHQELELDTRRTQRGRVVMLFETSRDDRGAPPALNAEGLRAFHRALAADKHRVITVRHRK